MEKIDYHVHFGQWFDTYYSSKAVFSALKSAGIEEVWFSSTSSGRYCKESIAVQKGKSLQVGLPSASELYEAIKEEVKAALEDAKIIGLKAYPLYWVVPEIHKSESTKISVKKAMSEVPYKGFKLHPGGSVWDLTDDRTYFLAEEVFCYAEKHGLLILIHCGPDDFELPTKFEPFIARHPNATVQLAHIRPLEETLYMLRKYPNTLCDTAFASAEVQGAVKKAGFGDRMRYGSDFPINYWFEKRPKENPSETELADFLKVSLNDTPPS